MTRKNSEKISSMKIVSCSGFINDDLGDSYTSAASSSAAIVAHAGKAGFPTSAAGIDRAVGRNSSFSDAFSLLTFFKKTDSHVVVFCDLFLLESRF